MLLIAGQVRKTHHIVFSERQFVTEPHPRYIHTIEYYVTELEVVSYLDEAERKSKEREAEKAREAAVEPSDESIGTVDEQRLADQEADKISVKG